MVVDIKNLEVKKGKTARRWLAEMDPDFVVAIGDDATDEDTFKAMPDSAYTIKVGDMHSAAKFSIKDPRAVRKLLHDLNSK